VSDRPQPPSAAANATLERRAVLLFGASNLTLSFARAIAKLRAAQRGPLDVIAAYGHGRSYGLTSRVLGRELPGILACGAWSALAATRSGTIDALLTDIGNDIMYGQDVATVAGWIEECVERLRARGARVVLSRLPLASVERLSRARFAVARAIFFPTRRVALDVVRERTCELDARLREIACAHGVRSIQPRSEWYGFDPIHIRRAARDGAWTELLGGWDASAEPARGARLTLVDRIALARLRPAERRMLGRVRTRAQPAAVLTDGTTVASY
jgi:hypothetical protein